MYVPLRQNAQCTQGRVELQASLAGQASSTSRRPTWRHNTSNFLQTHVAFLTQLCVLVAKYLQTVHGYNIGNYETMCNFELFKKFLLRYGVQVTIIQITLRMS
jgi:hypothetical protein